MSYLEGENERLLKSFQLFSNSLLKVSDTFKKLSSNTKNSVIEPFTMFIENYRDTNRVGYCLFRVYQKKQAKH